MVIMMRVLQSNRAFPDFHFLEFLIIWTFCFKDELLQVRLYSTEEDELDKEAWKVVAW